MSEIKLKDKVLLAKIKHNDRQAFIKAYDQYVDDIYRFIYFKVGKKEEAEDLSSATFLKTWSYLQNNDLTDCRTLKALFYKTARNLVIDHYRKNNHDPNIILSNTENGDIADERQNIAARLELSSDFNLLEDKLRQLKGEYQEVIILRFLNELSFKEIAEVLNKSRGNVRVLLYRAINALKELVRER